MRREIEFIIDSTTGEMSIDIHGIVGPACDDVQKLIEKITGAPATVEKKPSYFQQVKQVGTVNG